MLRLAILSISLVLPSAWQGPVLTSSRSAAGVGSEVGRISIATPNRDSSVAIAKDPFEEARKLLRSGKAEEARQAALSALGGIPYDPDGFALMRQISAVLEDSESQLRWGKWEWWNRKYTGNLPKKSTLGKDLSALWEGWNQDELILEEWEASLAKAARKAGSKKAYRLAGHLMDKLLNLNLGDAKLEKEYEKLAYKAGQELTGGSFAAASIRRKSSEWLAKQNAKHEDWENPFERKTKHYELKTNISWEFAETAASAMDEINEFYRSVYNYKKKAGAKIFCMRKRSDFDRMTLKVLGRSFGDARGVGGYWVGGLKTVVAYDRSYDEEGWTQDAIWRTLFHEASHQFMDLLTKSRHKPPCWLNEGTSCYFEGCVIKADGTIVKNNPAVQRLKSWYMLDTNPKTQISLERLIAHPRNVSAADGSWSYEGEFYPYGWALVYFLLNYEENDRRVYITPFTPSTTRINPAYKEVRKAGRLVYKQAYGNYLEHFSERDCDGDRYYALEMAKKFFVEDVKDPDVPDWDAFEARWRKFCTSLYQEQEEMGMEFADVLQARSRGYLLSDDFERARITAEQADDKRPDDSETYRLLALANSGEGRKMDAIFWMIRFWEKVWPAGEEKEAVQAEAWLAKNGGKDYLKTYIQPTKDAVAALTRCCQSASEANRPTMSALFALHGIEALGMDLAGLGEYITAQAAAAEPEGPHDLRMWQAAYNRGSEGNRFHESPSSGKVDLVLYEEDGVVINNPKGPIRPGMEFPAGQAFANLRPPFQMRAEVTTDGGWGYVYLGMNHRRVPKAAFGFGSYQDRYAVDFSLVELQTNVDAGTAFNAREQVGGFSFKPAGNGVIRFDLNVDVDGTAEIQVNDLPPQPMEEFEPHVWEGGFAITADDGVVTLWSGLEVRSNRAFWPVP